MRYRLLLLSIILALWALPAALVWQHLDHQRAILQVQLDIANTSLEFDAAILSVVFGEPWDRDRLRTADGVTLSAYSSTRAQCDSTPHETASGSTVSTNCAATSRDLPIPFDKVILVPGVGTVRNEDTMGRYKTIRGQRVPIKKSVDLWMPDTKAARAFGVSENRTIMWLEEK